MGIYYARKVFASYIFVIIVSITKQTITIGHTNEQMKSVTKTPNIRHAEVRNARSGSFQAQSIHHQSSNVDDIKFPRDVYSNNLKIGRTKEHKETLISKSVRQPLPGKNRKLPTLNKKVTTVNTISFPYYLTSKTYLSCNHLPPFTITQQLNYIPIKKPATTPEVSHAFDNRAAAAWTPRRRLPTAQLIPSPSLPVLISEGSANSHDLTVHTRTCRKLSPLFSNNLSGIPIKYSTNLQDKSHPIASTFVTAWDSGHRSLSHQAASPPTPGVSTTRGTRVQGDKGNHNLAVEERIAEKRSPISTISKNQNDTTMNIADTVQEESIPDEARERRCLSPSPAPLPASAALSYVMSAVQGPLAVVDVGDAPRWLAPLHACARAPLLLWRAPVDSSRGNAPRWLEGNGAYLLATDRETRLLAFLNNDTADAVPHNIDMSLLEWHHRNLQLRSTVPMALTVAHRPGEEPMGAREGGRLLLELRRRHQTFRGLLLTEHPAEEAHGTRRLRWRAQILVPYSRGARSVCGAQRFSLIEVPVDASAAVAARLSPRLSRDAGASMIITSLPDRPSFKNVSVDEYGFRDRMVGPGYRLVKHLQLSLNMTWCEDDAFRKERNERWITMANTTHMFFDWYIRSVVTLMESLRLDFCAMYFGGAEQLSKSFDALGASVRLEDYVVVVPRAPPLPAWSLPLRVFEGGVWGALAAAATAYAVAWRVVAGKSLAEGVAAALRAFSSCGGPPQDRVVRGAPRLQLAGALLAAGVVVVSAYQGRLFTLMTRPAFYPELEQLRELEGARLPLVSSRWESLSGIASRASGLERRVVAQAEEQRLVRRRSRIAWVLRRAQWREVDSMYRLGERMHVMREPAQLTLMMMFARRNWPWSDAVNAELLRLDAAGLRSFWAESFDRLRFAVLRVRWQKRGGGEGWGLGDGVATAQSTEKDAGPRAFRWADVTSHLQMLAAGEAIAIGVFCAEAIIGAKRWGCCV